MWSIRLDSQLSVILSQDCKFRSKFNYNNLMYVTGAYIIEQLAGLWEMIIELYTEFAYKHNIALFLE